jgi:rhombotail lipoprotein
MKSRLAAACTVLLVLTACISTERRVRSNALEYLYPKGGTQVPPSDVRLTLPVRVGIAFVPEAGEVALDAARQQALLERVAAAFRGREGIGAVDAIPTSYLNRGGGFDDLERIRSAFGIDLIALVSYDQFQFSGRGNSSIFYWTLVGAYTVKGEKNETRTMVDALVYDVPSKAMLFRASGESAVGGKSTPIKAELALRKDADVGFDRAVDDLIVKLDGALSAFVEQAKSGTVRGPGTPAVAFVDQQGAPTSPGAGGGALDATEIALAAFLLAASLVARRT